MWLSCFAWRHLNDSALVITLFFAVLAILAKGR
jgi:hypothetical protein